MDILLVGRIGESGALNRANAKKDLFDSRFPRSFLKAGISSLSASYVNEEATCLLNDRAEYMYMVGGEGIYAALWNLGELLHSGLRALFESISVSEFVIAAAELTGESPYDWDSTGCILLTAKDGTELAHLLAETGTQAQVIGYLTDDNDRCIINGETLRFLTGRD